MRIIIEIISDGKPFDVKFYALSESFVFFSQSLIVSKIQAKNGNPLFKNIIYL